MAFNLFNGRRVSVLAMTTGMLVSGCGGGASGDATTQAAVTSKIGGNNVATVTQPASGATTTTSSSSSVVGKRSAAAINLTGINYFSPELPTIDVMKRAGDWLTQCSVICPGLASGASSWDTLEESALDLDADGWVKSLPASSDTTHAYRVVSTMLSANGALPMGRYIVRYDGEGTITYAGATKNSASTAGRDVVDLNTTGNVWLSIAATNPSNYLRNIRIYMPGGACANDLTVYAASAASCNSTTGAYVPFESFPATQIWHPKFLQDMKGFRALRFMDWSLTTTNTVQSWSNRTSPTARTWVDASGVPLEAMLDLANMLGADAWLNVPVQANDDYAAHMGALAATHLTNGVSKMDLEYGNEPWNFGFAMATWMINQAKAKWPALLAQGVSQYDLGYSWYGERLAQVCKAAKTGSNLVRCVMNGQAANPYVADQYLTCQYAAAELGHACAKDVDILAIAPYFGGYISGADLRSTVATWYTDPDGGLNKLFQEIDGTNASGAMESSALLSAAGSGAPNGALALAKSWMVATKALADKYGLPMWAYEGGQGMVQPAGSNDASLQSLFVAANTDPRMGAAYDQMMADWKAAGGQTFAYYSHIGPASIFGMWGLKQTIDDNSAPKWVAAAKARDDKSCNWAGC